MLLLSEEWLESLDAWEAPADPSVVEAVEEKVNELHPELDAIATDKPSTRMAKWYSYP